MSRILWHSVSPLTGTGYGQQTATFTPRIRDLGHDVAISAYWGLGGGMIGWNGITVYPGDEQFGNRLLPTLAEHHHAELIITLMDVWVLKSKSLDDLPLASWVPVDHDPCPQKVVDFFTRTRARPIAMSRFGERMLLDAALDPLYVPHGIDTKVFRPRPETREETRRRMNIPADAFVVGMVAANKGSSPSRKAFPQVFQAFTRLRARHPDAYIYLHTAPAGVGPDGGVAILALADACGLDDEAIRFTDTMSIELGLKPDAMACVYSAFDVLANPSYGEGFGIPIVEAQSCGTPVIVTDCTAMTELCGDGWTVGGEDWYDAHQRAFWKCPSVAQIDAALEEAYEQRGQGPSQIARDFALDYDADLVTSEYWIPALEALGVKAPSKLVRA
jgi:glycosyltransferase involved in cell wall biosynthesis